MTVSHSGALTPVLDRRPWLEAAIAVLVVSTVAMVVVQPTLMVLAFCIPLAFLAVFSFDWFVFAVIFFLPWYPIHDVLLPTRLALFLGVLVLRYRKGASLKSWLWEGWLRKGVWAFAVIVVVSLVVSDYRMVASPYGAVAREVSYIATFFAVAGWADTRDKMLQIIQAILLSTIGVCLFGFWQAFVGDFTGLFFFLYSGFREVYEGLGGWTGRITSFLYHYNSLAGYLNIVAPLALGVAVLADVRRLRTLGFVSLGLISAALYLTSSRGAFIAYGVFLVVAAWYLAPLRRTVAVVMTAAMMAALIALPLAVTGGFESERLQSVDDFTQQSRLAMWGAATLIFLQHPVLGAGVGTFRYRFHQYVPGVKEDLDAHNLYLHLLAEVGIVGFLLFFMNLWGFFRRSTRLVKGGDTLGQILGIAVIGALATTLVHGLVDYIFLVSPQFGALFWLLLALSLVAYEGFREAVPVQSPTEI